MVKSHHRLSSFKRGVTASIPDSDSVPSPAPRGFYVSGFGVLREYTPNSPD